MIPSLYVALLSCTIPSLFLSTQTHSIMLSSRKKQCTNVPAVTLERMKHQLPFVLPNSLVPLPTAKGLLQVEQVDLAEQKTVFEQQKIPLRWCHPTWAEYTERGHTGETNGADEADVDDLAVAKARCSEIDLLLHREIDVLPRCSTGKEGCLSCGGPRSGWFEDRGKVRRGQTMRYCNSPEGWSNLR